MSPLSSESLAFLQSAPVRQPRHLLSIEENRESLERLALIMGEPDPEVAIRKTFFDSIPVTVYTPPSGTVGRGVCVYSHGGGWVLGSVATHHVLCARLSVQSDCTVVSVDYRRPPENPFPAALEDVLKVIHEVRKGAISESDTSRIAIAGDSAGGNLSAAAALALRGVKEIKFVVLLMPVLDNRFDRYPSYEEFGEGFSLTAADMDWYFTHYAGEEWKDSNDPRLVPMRETDLRSFPRTLIMTAECDVLRDEGEEFAQRLIEAKVQVTAFRVPGTFHPFILFPNDLDSADDSISRIASEMNSILGPSSPNGSRPHS